MSIVSCEIDAQGIAVLTWNDPQRPVNSLAQAAVKSLSDAIDAVLSDATVAGIILTSAKKDFVVGADLYEIQTMDSDAALLLAFVRELHGVLRRLERGGKPVVAALNGSALGGGLEVALACHYRIAAANPKARFGFPEVNLGLLPGGGGTQRLARLLGIQAALPWLLQATQANAEVMQQAGILHEVVVPAALIARAKEWLLANPKACVQPWDQAGFKLPGGAVQSAAVAQIFMGAEAMVRQKTHGNYLAPQRILQALYEGCQLPLDLALDVEAKYFTELLLSNQSKAMIRTFFIALQNANKLKHRPQNIARKTFSTLGVLGAGMMGAGIAYAAAMQGIKVILLDAQQTTAERGKAYSEGLLNKRISRGKLSPQQAADVLQLITPTTEFEDLCGCELVIEAVFEDREVKREVTQKAETVVDSNVTFASNTSTLPITGLAQASQRPAQFIGLHFFSPVDKMPLVEVIVGEQTSQETLAWALDFVQQLRKTPIVVKDSRGFYTTRVFKSYVLEGMALLQEGVALALIENAGKLAGMPIGPLALSDEVSLELMDRIGQQAQRDLGDGYPAHPGDTVVAYMVQEANRIGKRCGKGFYDYPATGKKQLWTGIHQRFPLSIEQPTVDLVKQRLLYAQAVEALHCVSEGVITLAHEVDLGSVLGWGFAPHTGGVLSYIETIEGMTTFLAQADQLAKLYGSRFTVPENFRQQVAEQRSFY